ncbi:MAG TPA: glycoside hydrolase family 57 protein [Bacteroidales bacterium]|nr:glycoside hydrolase family 57 protein [Bacteroidales bacterium]HOX77503.1 glycoside hydrolase family 57 protein [Bacteroidales bacterium]
MRSVCFYFQIHQPVRLRTYRFFDIGAYHNYYDDYQNRFILRRVADKSYLPMNKLLLELIKEYGPAFRVSFSISGLALEQMKMYAPDVLQSFKKLADTGSVEFLAETYAHSLSSLRSRDEFISQVQKHREMIKELFGVEPVSFRNTELIYSDGIGEMAAEMGFKAALTEGARHILGWKTPNFIYCNALNPKLKVLMRNYQLSDDIAFRFSERGWSEWPLTTEKFVDWLNAFDRKHEVVNLFMDYETFGEHQWRETGIFDFMKALPARIFSHSDFTFNTPSELADKLQPVSAIHVEYPISWADEERDLTAWLGNDLQDDAFDNLYALEPLVKQSDDPEIRKDWCFLQASDHFYYMCTKWFSDGDVHKYFNPYGSPYDAYINYMNVLADFRLRLEKRGSLYATRHAPANEPDAVVPAPVKKAKKDAKDIKPVTKTKQKTAKKPVLKKKDAPKKPR